MSAESKRRRAERRDGMAQKEPAVVAGGGACPDCAKALAVAAEKFGGSVHRMLAAEREAAKCAGIEWPKCEWCLHFDSVYTAATHVHLHNFGGCSHFSCSEHAKQPDSLHTVHVINSVRGTEQSSGTLQ